MSSGENPSHDPTKKLSKNDQGQKLDAVMAFLKKRHPELFQVAPRTGGFQRHLSASYQDEIAKTQDESSTSNVKYFDRPISAASLQSSTANMRDILVTNIKCPKMHRMGKDGDDKDNRVRVLSIVISTVMMLARHSYEGITAQHAKHAEEYFRVMKQEEDYPQNIGRLLQLVLTLRKAGKLPSPSGDDDEEEEDEEITIGDLTD